MRRYDPIQRVIDWQMRSVWGWLEAGLIRGGNHDRGRIDLLEDMIIAAIDEKYLDIAPKDYNLLTYRNDGFSCREIGEIFGISHTWARKKIKNLLEIVSKSASKCP